jgi:hypothetical protein
MMMIETLLKSITAVPLSISIPAVLFASVLISLIGSFIVRELFTYQELVGNNEIVGVKYGLFGEVFAVALGLALVGAYSLYMGVRETSSIEVSALRSLYYSAAARDESQGGKAADLVEMRMSVVNYARSVAEDEWTLMADGKMSEQTTKRLKGMFDIFLKYNEPNIMNAAQLGFLGDIVEARGLRSSTATRTITQIVWVILVSGVLLIFLGPVFIGAPNAFVQALVTSLFSAFIMLNILALVHLAHPFTGELAITASPYLNFIEETKMLSSNPG